MFDSVKTTLTNTLSNRWYIVLMIMVAAVGVSLAQTPVPIVVDTNAIFTQTNSWISVFTPIVAIGIGIAIALAILTFIGNQILKAFRGNSRN